MKEYTSVRAAVFFENFGPYHVARLNAAGKVCKVAGLEWRGRSKTYAWKSVDGTEQFEKRTLLGSEAGHCSRRDLMRLLEYELDPTSLDVVVVNGWGDFGSLAVISWALKHGIPAIFMSESTAWDEPRKPWKEFIKRQIVTLGSAALAGGTPHREYLTQLGMPSEQIFLGYDAVDNSYFADKVSEVRSQKSEFQVSGFWSPSSNPDLRPPSSIFHLPSSPFFLASARFVEKKNLPRLIQAYARYRELAQKSETGNQQPATSSPHPVSSNQQPATFPWNLVILGDGPLRSDLCHLISELRLQSSVLLPGFIQYPELPTYYANAGAFIHASTTEQWGLVVNEAMASGLPVLVSNRCGCARDLVQEGVNGFTFDPYDVEQLAQLMLKISAFYFLLSAFGDASQRIVSNWGPDRFASGLKAAAECALKVGPVRPTFKQKLILKALLSR